MLWCPETEGAEDKDRKPLASLVYPQKGQPILYTQFLFNVCVLFELSSLNLYSLLKIKQYELQRHREETSTANAKTAVSVGADMLMELTLDKWTKTFRFWNIPELNVMWTHMEFKNMKKTNKQKKWSYQASEEISLVFSLHTVVMQWINKGYI